MKTFLEQLQESVGTKYPLRTMLDNLDDDQIIEEVNLFSKSVAQQALENASENVFIDWSTQELDKSSITNPDNIPAL